MQDKNSVSDDMFALSKGAAGMVRTGKYCIANGVCYSTNQREVNKKTQNSFITSDGQHYTRRMKETAYLDYYGYIQDIYELCYNDRLVRSVVLFKCYWYDQQNKRAPKNDGYFTSINTEGQWYREEPYVLSTQVSKILLLDDNSNKGPWKIVQKFQPRHMYDVDENERPRTEVAYQDDATDPSAGNNRVEAGIPDDRREEKETDQTLDEGFTVEASIVRKELEKQNTIDEPYEIEDDDETLGEYFDPEATNNEFGFHDDYEDDD